MTTTPHPLFPASQTQGAGARDAALPPARHIHLVEDDPSMQRAVSTALAREGYEVSVFDSMEAYVQGPRPGQCVVAILDMRLPGQSGLAVAQWLERQDIGIPVIFISGDSAPQEIIDALQGGAHDFLLKPFRLADLQGAVARAFDKIEARQQADTRLERLRRGWERLTPREREVCVLMLQGMANREIARINGSVAGTVKVQRSRVLAKMEVASVSELFEMAGRQDLREWLQGPEQP